MYVELFELVNIYFLILFLSRKKETRIPVKLCLKLQCFYFSLLTPDIHKSSWRKTVLQKKLPTERSLAILPPRTSSCDTCKFLLLPKIMIGVPQAVWIPEPSPTSWVVGLPRRQNGEKVERTVINNSNEKVLHHYSGWSWNFREVN